MAKTIKYNAVEDKTSELNKRLEDLTCTHCDSKFSCETEDLYCKTVRDAYSNNKSLVVDCPVCDRDLRIENDDTYLNLKTWPAKPSDSYWDK